MHQPRKKRILIVDDDQTIHLGTKYALRDSYECCSAYNCDEAKLLIEKQSFDLMLLDLSIRSNEEGLDYLPIFKKTSPDLDIIVVSGNSGEDLASQTIKKGASAYLVKGHSTEQLLITIRSVLSKQELERENQHYRQSRKRSLDQSQIIGKSPAIKKLLSDIEKVKQANANVLIIGDTGTGKELVARHLSYIGNKPFVPVDSATITSTMAESILFGHEKGAFTGAQSQSIGLFEEADGGTVYFDEIGNMPLEIQVKLLRVLQEKEISRVGSSKVIPLDFRVIAATNQDLEKLCEQGKFKYDLLHRLNVITLQIPPLRERIEDLELLVPHFLKQHAKTGTQKKFSDEALDNLYHYPWPGNIRELSNLVANLCTMLNEKEVIEANDLPPKITKHQSTLAPNSRGTNSYTFSLPENREFDFFAHLKEIEQELLAKLYLEFGKNITEMSKKLNISRTQLYSKLQMYGIHPKSSENRTVFTEPNTH